MKRVILVFIVLIFLNGCVEQEHSEQDLVQKEVESQCKNFCSSFYLYDVDYKPKEQIYECVCMDEGLNIIHKKYFSERGLETSVDNLNEEQNEEQDKEEITKYNTSKKQTPDIIKCNLQRKEEVDGSDYKSTNFNPKNVQLKYILKGETKTIDFVVYKGLKDYLDSLSYQAYNECDYEKKILEQPRQREQLLKLVNKIKGITPDKESQAKIAVSIVKNIPYDYEKYRHLKYSSYDVKSSEEDRYPYEVLYDMKGICGEKAKLTAFLLKELGYGVALFNTPDHQATGIKCPLDLSFKKTGYCWIETTDDTYIIESPENLDNPDSVMQLYDGVIYTSIKIEKSKGTKTTIIKDGKPVNIEEEIITQRIIDI